MIEIQPVGGAAIDEGALRARLAEIGIHAGVARGSVDPELLALEMRALSPEYSFIGVRLQGVRLLLEASKENAAPETFDIDDPRDLVASCAGVVVSVNVRAGEACVKAGDTVVKGQTLIRGAERIGKEERASRRRAGRGDRTHMGERRSHRTRDGNPNDADGARANVVRASFGQPFMGNPDERAV